MLLLKMKTTGFNQIFTFFYGFGANWWVVFTIVDSANFSTRVVSYIDALDAMED